VTIVGVSFDDPEANQAWAEDEGYAFDLWTDDDKTVALYYGAASSESQAYASRMSFLLDEDGTLVLEYLTVNTLTNAEEVLSDCEILFGS
jgi:thioredoxin-dependent peroxiredoxin